MMTWIEKLRHARRVSCPLVAINTPDPGSTVRTVAAAFGQNGKAVPIVQWDVCRGVLPVNEAGRDVARLTGDGDDDVTIGQPAMLFSKATDFPPETILLVHNSQAFMDSPVVVQGVWNLRDLYKADNRMLVLLARDHQLPPLLSGGDVVVLDEALPDEAELTAIVQECDASRGKPLLDKAAQAAAVEAVKGLNAFAAEQAVAMSLRKEGIDMDHLWSSKVAEVEQTKGLSVHRGGAKFDDLGGLVPLKDYLAAIMNGRKRIKLVVWLDEVEKTGLAARGDTSGVNQDQEGTLLQHLQDTEAYGVMLLGVPGTGKSAICKAVGAEFDRLVIRIDMGAMQGSLVGQSQQTLRAALKVITAIGGNDVLWLATSNSISGLSGAMRSRFTDTFFFDLPTAAERKPIWKVWLKKLGLTDKPYDGDEGWVGRDIRKACEKAWTMNRSIDEVARFVVPVASIEREEIARLRDGAHDRYLSAQRDGVYKKDDAKRGRARINLD